MNKKGERGSPCLTPREHSKKLEGEPLINTENRTARTQPGRDAMNRKFEDQVDPERKLPAAERAKLVEAARKLYFHRLAFASAKARRQRNEARKSA